MAYRDASGAITIDEAVAYGDISKIRSAISYLQQSRQSINQLIGCVEPMQGQTGAAIGEKSLELRSRVDALIANLETSAALISATVSRYQQIDAELAQAIKSNAASIPAPSGGNSMANRKPTTGMGDWAASVAQMPSVADTFLFDLGE